MLTRRAAYLGLIVCLATTTVLGMQPQLIGIALVEPESGTDSPTEEPGGEKVKSDSGIPLRRRGTVLVLTVEVLPVKRSDPHRSVSSSLFVSTHTAVLRDRNGFGGPLRL